MGGEGWEAFRILVGRVGALLPRRNGNLWLAEENLDWRRIRYGSLLGFGVEEWGMQGVWL